MMRFPGCSEPVLLHEALAIRRLGVLVATAVVVGCSGRRVENHSAKADVRLAADTIALDSCASLDRLAAPQRTVLQPGEVIPAPHPGTWTDVKRLNFGAVSIEVPRTTTLGRTDSASVAIFGFPACRYFCAINITLVHDSIDRSLDAYVASLRAVDTVADPDDERPGPPRAIRVGPDRGFIMDMPCGDCGSEDLVVKRGNTIARISSIMDDREGHQPGVECRLTRVATTFRWIDPNAAISTRPSNGR